MSRVGKHTVSVPSGVTVDIANSILKARGKLGELSLSLPEEVTVTYANNEISVQPKSESDRDRAMWGTTRNNIRNLVEGVSQGFTIDLEINGVGYRAAVQGNELVLQLGFSHDVKFSIPNGISIKCEKPTSIQVHGANKQQVGQVAAKIRDFRSPEPYKGKGIKYSNEVIFRKEGKKK